MPIVDEIRIYSTVLKFRTFQNLEIQGYGCFDALYLKFGQCLCGDESRHWRGPFPHAITLASIGS